MAIQPSTIKVCSERLLMYKNKFFVDFLARGFIGNCVNNTYQSSHVASTEFFTTLDFHSSPPTPDIKKKKRFM